MDRPTLEFIYGQAATKTLREQVLTSEELNDLPGSQYAMRNPDGGLSIYNFPKSPPAHVASDIKTLVSVAMQYKDSSEQDTQIWYCDNSITLLFHKEKFGQVCIGYTHTEPFKILEHWSKLPDDKLLTQPELIQLLRTKFYKCIGTHPNLIKVIRNINTKTVSESETNMQRSKTSISKSLVREATGLEAVPETLTLHVQVHEERPFTAVIECAIEFDEGLDKFRISPYPGEITKAVIASDKALLGEIEKVQKDLGTNFPVYHGNV